MSRTRISCALGAFVLTIVGYAVPRAVAGTVVATQFQLQVATTTEAALGSVPNYVTPEELTFTECQWAPTRTSITVTAAHSYQCYPSEAGQFPIPAADSFALISTPVDGRAIPDNKGKYSDELRFVHLASNRQVIEVSAPLFEFSDVFGGAAPSIVERDGALWMFDYITEHGPEVLRVSTTTGAILQRTTMPAISRPVFAANQLGFWLAQNADSFYGNPKPALGVWFAPLGASKSVLVKQTSGNVLAMQPDGKAMDVYLDPSSPDAITDLKIWRFTLAR